jgi:SpoVK/Ycf46/Vps4 family AAA+-type ATPase
MTLADDVNLEEFVMTKDEFSGADIKAICTEAGLLALRERRMKVRSYFYIFCTIFAKTLILGKYLLVLCCYLEL